MPDGKDDNPLLTLGLNYVRFGHEEKNLFRFLYQTDKFVGMDIDTLMGNPGLLEILKVVAGEANCDIEEARKMFLTFFSVAHGLASLLANNSMKYDEEQITEMLKKVFFGMLSAGE